MGLRIYEYLHKSTRLTAFASPCNPYHGVGCHKRRLSELSNLRLGHADTTERRIGEEPIDWNTVFDRPLSSAKDVVGDNFVIVVRCMGKCATSIDVAKCPDAINLSPQVVVDRNEPACIRRDTGRSEVQVC